MMIAQAQIQINQNGQLTDGAKKEAAEFLAQQSCQIYEDRRSLLAERDTMVLMNADLQRLNIALKCDLERYQ